MARQFLCTPQSPVVETGGGRLRGFQLDGVYTFYGIHYAEAERFEAPHPVEPWEGVKEAYSYGFVCPLMDQDTPSNELMVPHRYWPMNEHCQNLNIWTTSLDPAAKKPVMVWLHGGGFSSGSAIEHIAYEGDQLASFGDVVVVSVNHRLNILGYLDLSAFGPAYANSANAGNADLVAALEWIHDNIAHFGGDPDNVTLFGQSGGGEKVIALMNTPAADGLFHRGIIESGVIDLRGQAPTDGEPLVKAMLTCLGMTADEAGRLSSIPYASLVEAYKAAAPGISEKGGYIGNWPGANDWYPGHPSKVGFTEHAKTIPVLIGTVMGEFAFGDVVSDKYSLSDGEIGELLDRRYGGAAPELIRLFDEAYPGKNRTDLLYVDALFRKPTRSFVGLRTKSCTAATYSYMFAYDFPIDGGRIAWHCSEIPYVFHNSARAPLHNVPGQSDLLEEQICGAFVNFARNGDPNAETLPEWKPCTEGREETMVFDTVCALRSNFDAALTDRLYTLNGLDQNSPLSLFQDKDAEIQH